jgi:hypothetical protein
MYPITPFLIVLGIPAANKLFRWLLEYPRFNFTRMMAVPLAYLFLFCSIPQIQDNLYSIMTGTSNYRDPGDLMHKEYSLSRRLASFPEIHDVTIAFADAGLISYYTEAHILDVVGLNDKYIAHERDHSRLVDYVFNQQPTIIFFPSLGKTWLRIGHGPLGDYESWSSDLRWADYRYVGTIQTNGYDIHMLVRRSYQHFDLLSNFLGDTADIVYPSLPLKLGVH